MNYFQILILIFVVVIITLLVIYSQFISSSIMNSYSSMGGFQRIAVIITLVLLLIIYVFVILNFSFAKKKENWPPIIADCPDFWQSEKTEENNIKCINTQDLGTCPPATGDTYLEMDFNTSEFGTTCAKYTWANNCGIAWDGITYGVNNPCETD